ncbi:MAG: type II secretion system protein GspG [Myxococcaceae bacterium]
MTSHQNTRMPVVLVRRPRGMTLIEIMVVVTILGLIAAAVAIAVVPQLDKANVDRAALDIRSIEGGLKLYYARKGQYPDTATGLRALVDTQILDAVPSDPWGSEYQYLNEGGKPVITSYGSDKTPGGEGTASDISNQTASK